MTKRVLITDFFNSQGGSNTLENKRKKTTSEVVKKVEVVEDAVENKENIVVTKEKTIESTVTTTTTATCSNIDTTAGQDYSTFCKQYNFDKSKWISSLTPEQQELLSLEINTLHITWLAFLHQELTKPYFLNLKRFLHSQTANHKTIYPPQELIYSWSHYTPLPEIKCLILGQDPYHNINQAHGLAFSVLEPTKPPPSLVNIYKTIAIDFPNFKIPEYQELRKAGKPGGGNLTKWARRGVLMLNAVLTVEAHKANSHAKRGWEQFTEQVIKVALDYHSAKDDGGFVIMAWGGPAQLRVEKFGMRLKDGKFCVLKAVHPSPLSAHRGFFQSGVFKKCNEWLEKNGKEKINWGIFDDNIVM
ncbi:UNG1 [[Candida] subhashii]|uniref:Uracil-DNA glycosylase n=1 Tax=[Candida] subhashii TaxID=561895 RepID=A0A8J5QHF5_9ASCO|nr:UNG1 [[Candida] subhashii]KAG7665759.1 UNG1 [[Candida] subhashii]